MTNSRTDGQCACCGGWVAPSNLVWDHCHACEGSGTDFRGWICSPCNTALTEHLEEHYEAAGIYLAGHECSARLFDLDELYDNEVAELIDTEETRFGNGNNRGPGLKFWPDPKLLTMEQIAGFLGLRSSGTVRDPLRGRKTGICHPRLIRWRRGPGKGNYTYLLPRTDALLFVAERAGLEVVKPP